jgi:putative FmdB family regulatory protein
MPTYEYRCAQGHEFEQFQRMSDDPLDSCPECGAEAQRLLSAGAGFLFKGSGFYITDYRSDSYREGAKRDSAGPVTAASPADPSAASSSKGRGSGSDSGKSGSAGEGAGPSSSGKGSGSTPSGPPAKGGSTGGTSSDRASSGGASPPSTSD